jgi:hexosaminidase
MHRTRAGEKKPLSFAVPNHKMKLSLVLIILISFATNSFAQNNENNGFEYRGMHLDVSRHFFSKEIVKQYIDTLAKYKLNYFHWHLTDDQGWRIEIKKYPLLTSVGAWRKEKDGSTYGGYYSQEDIRSIVKYAQERGVTVIPEIEIPGHSSAAIAAYPWLGCIGKQIEVPNRWGIFKDVYCPTDSTFQFLRDVLDEVCEFFPSHYIHIGGDEVPKQQWLQNSLCRELMKQQGLKNGEQLQHYIMKRIEDYLLSKGRRSIVWGEAIRGGINDSTVVMSWRGKGAGIKAAKNGNSVIMAPRFTCYFDYPEIIKDKKGAWYMTYLPVKKVARFNPHSKILTKEQNRKIIGGEATLWTEHVTNEKELWHQLVPRIAALGEALLKKESQKKAHQIFSTITSNKLMGFPVK